MKNIISINTILILFSISPFILADISGTITDVTGNPLPGAIVRLEKGGQSDTAGAEGHFLLSVSAVINPFKRNGRSVIGSNYSVHKNTLHIKIKKREIIHIACFDLAGRTLSRIKQTLTEGENAINLLFSKTGVYFIKVTWNAHKLLLKACPHGNMNFVHYSQANSFTDYSSVNRMEGNENGQSNDILSVNKDDYCTYRLELGTTDTSGMQVKMVASAGIVTDIDGNSYQTVQIGNQIWMAENLKVTKYADGTEIPLVKDDSLWNVMQRDGFCYTDNTNNPDSINEFGAVYNWFVVSPGNSHRIAPEGWHVPDTSEWNVLERYLVLNGYNWDGTTNENKIAKAMAAAVYWPVSDLSGVPGNGLGENNSSGFNALPNGFRNPTGTFFEGNNGYWWSSSIRDSTLAYFRAVKYDYDDLYRYGFSWRCGLSIRLVKD